MNPGWTLDPPGPLWRVAQRVRLCLPDPSHWGPKTEKVYGGASKTIPTPLIKSLIFLTPPKGNAHFCPESNSENRLLAKTLAFLAIWLPKWPKLTPKWPQNDHQLTPKWPQNDQKLIRKLPKTDILTETMKNIEKHSPKQWKNIEKYETLKNFNRNNAKH